VNDQLDEDDDWCGLCGSEGCKGECQDVPVGERPGEHLDRVAKAEHDRVHQATQEFLVGRLFPEPKENDLTLEGFERQLDRRAKVEVVKRPDGTTYRRRV